uniref:DZF domain-containing protein n=1 Tax=Mola mola TaxID=94237 RepID=A0A3Q3W5L1_MOLML
MWRYYDRHVMAKHSEVYPSPEELEAVQTIISHVECALKIVSDQMDVPKDDTENTESGSGDSQDRVLRGVMRPTVTLLKEVAERLTEKLEVEQNESSPGTYTVSQCPVDAAIAVTSTQSILTLTLHMTSPLVREEQGTASGEGYWYIGEANGSRRVIAQGFGVCCIRNPLGR